MKRVFFLMIVLLMIVSCSNSDSGNNGEAGLQATYENIIGDWYITSIDVIKGDHANWQGGKNLYFHEGGICHTCNKLENRYKINNGKVETYNNNTYEPMFIYTLLQWEPDKMVMRRDGTLDDTSSCKLTMVREDEPDLNPKYGNIEGTWYLKYEKWYGWNNGQPDLSIITKDQEYTDYADELIWTIIKSGNKLRIQSNQNGQLLDHVYTETETNVFVDDVDKFIITSFYTTIMSIEYYKNLFKSNDAEVEYGTYTFMRHP